MIDRDALEREMEEAWWSGIVAQTDVALAHIAAARASALEEAAKLLDAWASEGGQRVAILMAKDIRALKQEHKL